MSKPRLLDLFCGAGGAGMGYSRAGFEVVGVDIKPQRHYPFEFHQADALEFLREHGHEFDAIHASPPCQAYTISGMNARRDGIEYPDLVAATRELLEATGKPWVIENVPGAPIRADFTLCGCQFGIKQLRRSRLFETSWHGFEMMKPCCHTEPAISVVGHGTTSWTKKRLGRNVSVEEKRSLMGIDWMNREQLAQAIPPCYTEFIGRRLLAEVQGEELSA